MNFLHALCSVVLLSIFLFNITSCKTASYTRSFKDGNDDKSYAISGSEKASGTIAYSEDFTFLESLMFWKKIRRWYGTYTIKTKAVSEKLELKGKIVGSMNFLEGQLGDKTFEYYESPNAPAPFIAATLTVANDKKYLLQQVEELHWNINNADKDEKAIENYPHEIPATSKIQITDEENVVFAEFDMGTSKNSLSESFSRFLQVVSRYNSATYNIAFSKLKLKFLEAPIYQIKPLRYMIQRMKMMSYIQEN